MKLIIGNKKLKKGDVVKENGRCEGGIIVDINYEKREVYMCLDEEGYTCSEQFGNMGKMVFVD